MPRRCITARTNKAIRKHHRRFFQLNQGVDFDAEDKQPVDLVFAMLVPEESTNEHLELLSQLAEKFNHEEFRNKLRNASNSEEIYALFDSGSLE